jgi:hypothetical protein
MDVGFDDVKTALDFLKSAIGLVKETKDMLPASDQKTRITENLDTAERSAILAESEIAKSLGYQLCKCDFTPEIMRSIGYKGTREQFRCRKCNAIYPPTASGGAPPASGPNGWMGH